MLAESAISDTELRLIETLLWTYEAGFARLSLHMERMEDSARSLGFPFHRAGAETALQQAIAAVQGAQALRLRLTLDRSGGFEALATPPPASAALWRVAIADVRFDSSDLLLRHKTTCRAIYEDALARAQTACGADEVLFLNERDELCEGARSNLFVHCDGLWLTPALSCGLLPGVLRRSLLESGAREAVLTLADLEGEDFFLGNSLRGLTRARMAF